MYMSFFKMLQRSTRLAIGGLVLLVSACTGGAAALIASGGIGGTGMSLGPILLFGSVWVNGVEYDTSNADIYVEGAYVTTGDMKIQESLAVGQIVRVNGANNGDGTGTADEVYFEANLKGPLENKVKIDDTTYRFTVMQQQVLITENTTLKDHLMNDILDPDTFAANDVLEISGFVSADDTLVAMYVKREQNSFINNSTNVKIKGLIDDGSINVPDEQFSIHGVTIDYASANLPTGGLSNELYVQANGTYNGTQLSAVDISLKSDVDDSYGDEIEIQGIVTDDANKNTGEIILGNIIVHFDSNTEIQGGTLNDISAGVLLEIEGTLQSGILIAEEIEFEDEIKLESQVSSYAINADSTTLLLSGLTSTGNIVVNATAKFEGDADNLSDLNNILTSGMTDYVSIRGRLSGADVYVTEIKIEDKSPADTNVTLQGPVTNKTTTSITILNVLISNADSLSFEDGTLTSVQEGDIVKAEGNLVPGSPPTVSWDELEFENKD